MSLITTGVIGMKSKS